MSFILFFVTVILTGCDCTSELEDEQVSIEESCKKSDSHCCESGKNSEAQVNNNEEPHKGCSGNSCNPFKVCCSVFWITSHAKNPISKPLYVEFKQNFFYFSNYNSHYSYDFWQPPKFG